MSEPTPAETEATGTETIEVVFGGGTFIVSATPDDWDFSTLELFEDGKAIAAVKAILGEKQFDQFKSTKPKVRDFNEFMDLLAQRYGFKSAGE